MAFEFKADFQNRVWWNQNQSSVINSLKSLPSFIKQISDRELWFKAEKSSSDWQFDLRIFIENYGLFIESDVLTDALTKDFKQLIQRLRESTAIILIDDDDESINI